MNKQTCWFQKEQNPSIFLEKYLHLQKYIVWCNFLAVGVIPKMQMKGCISLNRERNRGSDCGVLMALT